MRKARAVATAKDSGAYVTAGCLSASLGYSAPKPSNLPSNLAVVLWLPEEAPKASASLPSRVGHVLPAVQRVLMSTEASPPDAIFLIDCTPLVPVGQSARAIMDKESSAVGADGQLGKSISKPVSRILDRLCAGCRDSSITLVGVDGGAPLALALLQHHKGVGTISRVVLLRPHLSAAVVNALLVKPSTTAPPALDVLYASERDRQRRDAAVRHAFPTGDSRVLDSHVSVGKTLYAALLSRHDFHHLDFAHLEGALVEPEQVDAVGRSVWWNEWSFELNRHTKQPEAVVSDLDPADVARAAVPGSPASVVAAAPAAAPAPTAATAAASGADGQQQWVGALVLRGSRCVLVRSLETPPAWKGLRVPTVALRPGEAAAAGAARAAVELCDIEEAEIVALPHIPPAALYLDGGRGHALIYPFYAAQPPPADADGRIVLENADLTDEEDLYDWYTWPRAVHALKHDARAIDTLRTLACGVAAAVRGGVIASKWGGYFGQEWLAEGSTSSAPLPQPSANAVGKRPAVAAAARRRRRRPTT